jgi:hypothetical protein
VHLQRLRLRAETECACLFLKLMADLFVFHFDGGVAGVADQERHGVPHPRVMAGHEGVDRLELVDEAVLEQKIQRPLHRRRGLERFGGEGVQIQSGGNRDGAHGLGWAWEE